LHTAIILENGLAGQLDRDRRPIVLPSVFSYSENYEGTQAAINEIVEYGLRKYTPLEVRFDKVEKLEPAATLALAAEIYRCRKLRVFRRGEFVTGNYPKSELINANLSEFGFYSLLKIADRPIEREIEGDLSRPIFLRFLTSNRVEPGLVDRFVSIIEKHVLNINQVARGRLVGAIKEAMGNVDEHAYSRSSDVQTMNKRWYLSARVNLESHEVLIILYDQGIGIPATIDTDLLETIRATLALQTDIRLHVSDGYTIKLATELWRTGTGQQGRGRGFRDMKRFVGLCADGELTVLSNRGRYTYVVSGEEHENHHESLGGTIIQWRFRNDAPLQMTDD
jgi:hypothetical protein